MRCHGIVCCLVFLALCLPALVRAAGEPAALIPQLTAADAAQRRNAAEELAGMGLAAVEPLAAVVREGQDPALRCAAVQVLARIVPGDKPDDRVVLRRKTIMMALSDTDAQLRWCALAALRELSHEMLSMDELAAPLLKLLKDSDPRLRAEAVAVAGEFERIHGGYWSVRRHPHSLWFAGLGVMSDETIVFTFPIAGALADENTGVVAAAITALIENGPWANRAVLPSLKHPSARVRRYAATVLQETADASTIPALVLALSDPDMQVQLAAEAAVIHVGAPAVHLLTESLQSTDAVTRRRAAEALGEIGMQETAADALLRLANDPEPVVRATAVLALSTMGDRRATPELVRLLDDPGATVRRQAADVLARLGDPAAVPPLIALLDPYQPGRVSAIQTLGQLKDRRAVPALRKLLDHPDQYTSIMAARALAEIGDPAALPAVLDKLAVKDSPYILYLRDHLVNFGPAAVDSLLKLLPQRDHPAHYLIIHTLGLLRDPRAIPALTALAQDKTDPYHDAGASALKDIGALAVPALAGLLQSEDSDIRSDAAYMLAGVGGDPVLAALTEVLGDPKPEVRSVALVGLQRLGDSRAIPAMIILLRDPERDVRYAAAHALAAFPHPLAVDALLAALQSPDTPVRVLAVTALGEAKLPQAIQPLRALREDPDPEVRRTAVYYFDRMESP